MNRHFIDPIVLLVIGVCLYGYSAMPIASTTPRADIWMPDGAVYSTLVDDTTLYIGGDFTYVGPSTGGGIALDATSAELENSLPKVNGSVYAIVSDGANGWYIGGAFDDVGGVARNNIAHIEKIGQTYSVDSGWNPNASNGAVRAMALSGATLYVGGDFTDVGTIGGAARNRLAAIQTSDGTATAWNPNANGVVRALALSGTTTLYIGGDFANVGGAGRNRLAALQTSDGTATVWNPNADGVVRVLALSGTTTLYVGGDFNNVGGFARNKIAALQTSDGTATAWNPGGAGINTINALTLSGGGTLYVGGDFTTTIGGASRSHIAELTEGSGLATAWNPNANGVVLSIILSGKAPNSLFVGGDFTIINSKNRLRLAEINMITGNAETWALSVADKVYAMAMSSDNAMVYAGGDFELAGGQARTRLAALNISKIVDVLATVDGTVYTVVADGATGGWYIGGAFTSVGGVARNNIARINADGTLDESWDPNANGAIRAMTLSPARDVLYVGGDFTNIDGKERNRLALLDTRVTANIARGWNPDANASVRAMDLALDGVTLYAGGDFTTMSGLARNHIAALRTTVTVNIPKDWNPDAGGGSVYAMVLSADDATVYVGGDFTTIAGATRNRIAALDTTIDTDIDRGWNPNVGNGTVYTMALAANGTDLYAGGDFTLVEGATRNRLVKLDATATANIDSGWDPDPDNTVRTIALSTDASLLYAGGDFTTIGSDSRDYFAAINTSSGNASNLILTVNNPVTALVVSDADVFIYLGGNALSVVGVLSVNGELLDIQAGTLTGFNPDVNGIVRAMAIDSTSSTLYIGGDFTSVTGQTRNRVAAINAVSGIATNWIPDTNNIVRAMELSPDDSTLYVAGDFTAFDGGTVSRPYIAAITTAAGALTPWVPDADARVRSMSLSSDGSVLYVGGDFTVIGQQARSRLAALSTSTGSALPAWAPDVTGNVYATHLSADENIIYAGGANELVAFNISDGAPAAAFTPVAVGGGSGTIETLEISSDDQMLYAGGNFTSFDGQARDNIARYDLAGDNITAWNPGADQPVHDLVLTNNNTNLFAAGDFTGIGTDPVRIGLAALPLTPPDTSVSPAAGSYSTSQDVTLTCTGNSGLGCLATYYTIDDTTPTTASALYAVPINIPVDSAVTIKYFSVDNEGTRESVKTAVYIVDTTAPTTTALPGTGSYNLLDGPISLICTDVGGSGCGATYYSIDGNAPTTDSIRYTGPIDLATLQGIDTLRFFSVDTAGNMESPANSIDYVVDVSPPVTAISHTSGTYSPPQTIILSCNDPEANNKPGSGCADTYYTTDLSIPTTASTRYTGPITISSGTVLRAMSVDVAGNPGAAESRFYAFTIGAGESRSGVGSAGAGLLLIMLAGLALRYRVFSAHC